MLHDRALIKGHVRILDAYTGEVLRDVDNLVVNSGLTWLRDTVTALATRATSMGYIGAGSGSTSAAALDTDLVSQVGSKVACTPTEPSAYAVLWTATFSAGSATAVWYEVGIFNNAAVATGSMLCRATFGALTKAANDVFTVAYTVSFADDGV